MIDNLRLRYDAWNSRERSALDDVNRRILSRIIPEFDILQVIVYMDLGPRPIKKCSALQ